MLQEINETKSSPLYPIGMRIAREDRVFRYCHAAGNLKALFGLDNSNVPLAPAVSITIGAGEGGEVGSKTVVASIAGIAVDLFAEGYFVDYMTPSLPFQCYRIKSNTATNGSGDVTLTLYDKLFAAVNVGDSCALYHNIYSAVKAKGTNEYMSVVCMSLVDVDDGDYFWGQTWGPIFGLVAGGDTEIGKTAKEREVYFHPTGGGIINKSDGTWVAGLQTAGFLLCDGSSFANGDQFFMLQLAP